MGIEKSTLNKFSEAYNEFFPVIYTSVYSRINNSVDCDDICQEIFIRFFKKIDEIENHRKWLFGTIRFVLMEHYRKKRDSHEAESLIDDIEVSYVNGFRDTRILIALITDDIENEDNDGEKLRIIFDYIAVNNFTYKETAKHLGLTEEQVRYRYGKCVKMFRDKLREKGISSLEDLL